jgi:hypothetical protein
MASSKTGCGHTWGRTSWQRKRSTMHSFQLEVLTPIDGKKWVPSSMPGQDTQALATKH